MSTVTSMPDCPERKFSETLCTIFCEQSDHCPAGASQARPRLTPLIRFSDKPDAPIQAATPVQQPVFEAAFSDDETDAAPKNDHPETSAAADGLLVNTAQAFPDNAQHSPGFGREGNQGIEEKAPGLLGKESMTSDALLGELLHADCTLCAITENTKLFFCDITWLEESIGDSANPVLHRYSIYCPAVSLVTSVSMGMLAC